MYVQCTIYNIVRRFVPEDVLEEEFQAGDSVAEKAILLAFYFWVVVFTDAILLLQLATCYCYYKI